MSDMKTSFEPPSDQPSAKKGMSGCAKAAIVVAVLGIIAFGICCVGGGFLILRSGTDDPVRVKAISDSILSWDGNERLTPILAVDAWIVRFAMFGDEAKGQIFIADSRLGNTEQTGQQMRGQMKAQFQQFEDTSIVEQETREFTIKGKPTEMMFNQAKGNESGELYWEIGGVVEGNDYPTFIFMRVLQSEFLEDDVIAMIESIR